MTAKRGSGVDAERPRSSPNSRAIDAAGSRRGDHSSGTAHFARPLRRLATASFDWTKLLRIVAPCDHRDPPIEKLMGHC
jgi:hypothetical protein